MKKPPINSNNTTPETFPQSPPRLVDECLELIKDLEENSCIAISTLNDLINYDKIETKTFTIEKKSVNLWLVVQKTINPLRLQAKEKGIDLMLNCQHSDPSKFESSKELMLNLGELHVIGDSMKLSQVIRNLVSNALKFTPEGGKVSISGEK